MNKQVFLLPVLIGLWQFAGWEALAAQQRLRVAEKQAISTNTDTSEDDDGEQGDKPQKSEQPRSSPREKKQVSKNGVTRKDANPANSQDKDEPKAGRKDREGLEPNEVGRVELSEKQAKNANLDVEVAGQANISVTLQLSGKINFNEDAVANVSARYPGVVKVVYKGLGDRVQKGEALALIESSESLRDYQVNSDISGTIVKKEVTIGELARDDKPIFVVADLSTVWVDFSVFPQDFKRLKPDQLVRINYADNLSTSGKISYIAPFGSENTQSMLARAVVQNPDGLLRPGLFVTGELFVDEIEAPVAVRPSAIQNVNEKTVIFVAEGLVFDAREVELGTNDGDYVQVLSGLNAGDRYVAGNSFLLKAELGKSEVQDSD
ncbi:MAG: efflux RND transporter periplasmic adaptor subunit [Verrucomicrobia bacterium]|nr:efflux RND transporter periplasmic adaptor subunit [Verrucomicrobiota bacterium]